MTEISDSNILDLADRFMKIRTEFVHKKGWKGTRIVISQKNPKESKNYPIFIALYRLLNELKDVNIDDYIKAQFVVSKREIFPRDLVNEWAIKRYFKWLKIKDRPVIDRTVDIPDAIKKDESFLALYIKNNNYNDNTRLQYEGEEVSVPLWLFLDKRLTHYFLYNKEDLIIELASLVNKGKFDKDTFKKIMLARESFRYRGLQ